MDVFAFAGLYGGINRRDQFRQVKKKDSHHIRYIGIGHLSISEQNRDGPPESTGIHSQQRKLGQKGLCTMPPDKIGSFAVAYIKNKSGDQIDNWERQPCDHRNQ
jgi:hypothetical protein